MKEKKMKYKEIMDRINHLASLPVTKVPAPVMEKVIAEQKKKTPKSAVKFEAAKKVIPGGCEHMLSHTNPYPTFIDRAQGAYIWDVDGNEYVDYICGGGPILLGHNHPAVMDKMIEMFKTKGAYHGLVDEYETLAAELIVKHMPSVDKVRFLQSGTEADMAAIRLARAWTGKKKIIKFGGTYHGWSDQLVVDLWVPHSGRFMANGIPEECTANTVIVMQNDLEGMERAIAENQGQGGVAAVIVEPLGAESGTMPLDESFPKAVENICKQNGIILIYDEVVTAFRMGMGGAQQYWGVDPELTVLGKIIGGGFPSSGALAGKAELIDCLQSGILSGGGPSAFVAGTMAASPTTCAASYFALTEIERTNASDSAAAIADLLISALNELFQQAKVSWFAYNYRSIIHVEMTGGLAIDVRTPGALPNIMERKAAMGAIQTFLRHEGLMTLMGKGYTMAAHTDSEVKKTVEAYTKLVDVCFKS
jgi:glutamate-1-semialdehyde 2,1-aminomutase